MNLGLKIKELRKLKKITQQELSSMLGVFYQAISRWENNITFPDITLLPILANIFNVSVDFLLDVNINLNEEKINNYLEESNQYLKEGLHNERTNLLRKALLEFPNSYKIMYNLADSLLNETVRNKNIQSFQEIINYCNIILDKCSDSKIRTSTIDTLATTYSYMGKIDEMKKLVDLMPSIENSKEIFMLDHLSLNDNEALLKRKELLSDLLTTIFFTMNQIANHYENKSNFKFKHTLDERINLAKLQLSILELIYDQKDYGYNAVSALQACQELVICYLEQKEIDQSINYLNKCYEFAYYLDNYNNIPNLKHTSILLKDLEMTKYCREQSTHLETLQTFIEEHHQIKLIKDDKRTKEIIKKIKTIN